MPHIYQKIEAWKDGRSLEISASSAFQDSSFEGASVSLVTLESAGAESGFLAYMGDEATTFCGSVSDFGCVDSFDTYVYEAEEELKQAPCFLMPYGFSGSGKVQYLFQGSICDVMAVLSTYLVGLGYEVHLSQ